MTDEADIMPDLARKVCDGFMVLGAMGVSVLVSSGTPRTLLRGFDCLLNYARKVTME